MVEDGLESAHTVPTASEREHRDRSPGCNAWEAGKNGTERILC
jgi:hypothetical protein